MRQFVPIAIRHVGCGALVLALAAAAGGTQPAPLRVAQVSMTPPQPGVTPKAMETIGAGEETPAPSRQPTPVR